MSKILPKILSVLKSSDHNLFDSEGWKHVLIDVHHNTLKASIQDESNANIMPEVSVTLEGGSIVRINRMEKFI